MDRQHFENLHVGEWVVATEVVEYEAQFDGPPEPYWTRRTVGGYPVQILAMSFPWMVVWDGQQRHTVDSRDVNFAKVSRAYVRQAMTAVREEQQFATEDPRRPDRDQEVCPRCKYPGRPRTLMTVGAAGWYLECPNCGYKRPDDRL